MTTPTHARVALHRRLSGLTKRLGLASAVVFAALTFAGCPPEYPTCDNDDHCKREVEGKVIDEVCVFGKCQECARDADCGDAKACVDYQCVVPCDGPGSCGDGKHCEERVCTTGCAADGDCGAGQACDASGACVTKQKSCELDSECGVNEHCEANACVAGAPPKPTANCTFTDADLRVQFEYNLYALQSSGQDKLERVATCMNENPGWRLRVNGHADERGSTDYNLSLGEKRAKSAASYIERLGVDRSRMQTLSYGEEQPLNPAASEAAWAQNRRAELVIRR